MAALHELRDKGLIEGRNGCYSRYHSHPSEWHATKPWPLLYCSLPRIPRRRSEPETETAMRTDYVCIKNPKAKEFVPIDDEPEEDWGWDRAPTSVGKGQARLDV